LIFELARARRPSPGLVTAPLLGRGGLRGCGVSGVGEQVPGAVSSLRATAVVAIFFPRRLAMRWKAAANSGERLAVCAASHSTQRSHTGPCLEM
jgi:hypothetical protein